MEENKITWTNKVTLVARPDLPPQNKVTAADMNQVKAGLNATIDELILVEGRVTTVETDLTTAEGDITTLQTDLTTAEGNIITLQTDLTTAEGAISTLETDLGVVELSVSTLDARVDFVESGIIENSQLHRNLGFIEEFEQRNDIEGRTKASRLVHNRTSDLVIESDNLHMIPSYVGSGVLPSILPNVVESNWTVTSPAGIELSKNRESTTRSILSVPANTPIILHDPDTYERLGVLNDVKKHNAIYSDTLDNAAWTTNRLGVATPVLGSVPSPISGENYWGIFETAVTDQHRIRQHTSTQGVASYANWLVCFTPKTGNDRDIRLEFSTGGAARDVFITSTGLFNGTAGGFNQQADYIRSEKIDLGDHWQIGILMVTASTSNMRASINANIGSSTANYLGDITKKILVQRAQIISIPLAELNDPMPLAIETGATVIDRNSDTIILEDWVTKGYMGSYSGRVTTKFGNGDIIEQSWEGDQLTVTTNGTPAAPITSAIPTDYTMLKGVINSVQIKKISDDAPDIPIGFDFNIGRGFGVEVDGGGSATPIVVTNLTQFNDAYAAGGSTKVIDVQANITRVVNSVYNWTSNLTIMSTNGSTIDQGTDKFQEISNVKTENIRRRRNANTSAGNGDLFNCRNTEGLLFKHCTFDGESSGLWTRDSLVYDGLVDFGNGASDDITVMFCQFLNHDKGMLLGSELFSGLTKVSLLWNYWYNVYQRFPRTAMSNVDLTNNYIHACRNGVGIEENGNIRGGYNYYKDCNKAIDYRVGEELGAYYSAVSDIFDNVASGTTLRPETVPSWTVPATVGATPYAVTAIAAADVPAFVLANSGNVLHTL